MKAAEKGIRKLINFSAGISAICIFLIMLMTVWDIVGRRLFSSSVAGVYELSSLGLVVISFAAMGLPQIEGENVGVTMIYDRLKPKVKAVFDFFIAILCIALFSVVFRQMLSYAGRMAASNQITPVLHMPLTPFIYMAAFGILVLILAFFWDLIKAVYDFKGINTKGDNTNVGIK
jgi:TRAP-type C4-dicarboxylate transport system permease small subunit